MSSIQLLHTPTLQCTKYKCNKINTQSEVSLINCDIYNCPCLGDGVYYHCTECVKQCGENDDPKLYGVNHLCAICNQWYSVRLRKIVTRNSYTNHQVTHSCYKKKSSLGDELVKCKQTCFDITNALNHHAHNAMHFKRNAEIILNNLMHTDDDDFNRLEQTIDDYKKSIQAIDTLQRKYEKAYANYIEVKTSFDYESFIKE